jgi:hypothetical protein
VRGFREVRKLDTILLSPRSMIVQCEDQSGRSLELAFRHRTDLAALLEATGAGLQPRDWKITHPWLLAAAQAVVWGVLLGLVGLLIQDVEALVFAIPVAILVFVVQGRALRRAGKDSVGEPQN